MTPAQRWDIAEGVLIVAALGLALADRSWLLATLIYGIFHAGRARDRAGRR